MPSTAESHFDKVKELHEQQQLSYNVGPAPVTPGPWLTLCGAVGPYAIRRPSPKQINRLEVLRCTRRAGHGSTFHEHADAERGPLAQWSRTNDPIWPPVIDPAARRPTKEGD